MIIRILLFINWSNSCFWSISLEFCSYFSLWARMLISEVIFYCLVHDFTYCICQWALFFQYNSAHWVIRTIFLLSVYILLLSTCIVLCLSHVQCSTSDSYLNHLLFVTHHVCDANFVLYDIMLIVRKYQQQPTACTLKEKLCVRQLCSNHLVCPLGT